MSNKHRRHSKVQQLPKKLQEEINKLLIKGKTYDEITQIIQEAGHEVSRSSVGRYGKNFLSRLERLKLFKDQAQAIVESNPDRPATELAEAANQISMQMIMEALMEIDIDTVKESSVTKLFEAISKLETSASRREKIKFEYTRGIQAAKDVILEGLRKDLQADPDLYIRLARIVEDKTNELAK